MPEKIVPEMMRKTAKYDSMTGPKRGRSHSSIGMNDRMECSCAMAASSLRNSAKRTVAKTSV